MRIAWTFARFAKVKSIPASIPRNATFTSGTTGFHLKEFLTKAILIISTAN